MTGVPRTVALVALAGLAACGENAGTGPSEAGTSSAAPGGAGVAGPAETPPALSSFRMPAGPLTACAMRRPARAPGESLIASIGMLDVGTARRPVAPPKLLLRLPPWPGDSIVPPCPDSSRLASARPRAAPGRMSRKGGRE
jgi:hypothetical protein